MRWHDLTFKETLQSRAPGDTPLGNSIRLLQKHYKMKTLIVHCSVSIVLENQSTSNSWKFRKFQNLKMTQDNFVPREI